MNLIVLLSVLMIIGYLVYHHIIKRPTDPDTPIKLRLVPYSIGTDVLQWSANGIYWRNVYTQVESRGEPVLMPVIFELGEDPSVWLYMTYREILLEEKVVEHYYQACFEEYCNQVIKEQVYSQK